MEDLKSYFTSIPNPEFSFNFIPGDKMLFLGSCFAQNIAAYMKDRFLPLLCNPYGTVYNPRSLNRILKHALEKKPISPDEIFLHKGLYRHFLFHSDVASQHKVTALLKMQEAQNALGEYLLSARLLVLTFGTNLAYFNGRDVVTNCHQLPGSQFIRRMLDPQETASLLKSTIMEIKSLNPDLQIVLTVSPVRHLRDNPRENTLSKASLHLMAEELQKSLDTIHYFPSFEILIDELRDYRWYNSDMAHPSESAIEIIARRFISCLRPAKEWKTYLKEAENMRKLLAHRPRSAATEEYRIFKEKREEKWNSFCSKFSFACKTSSEGDQ